MIIRALCSRLLGGAVLAVSFGLLSLVLGTTGGVAQARALTPKASLSSPTTLDGQPAPPDSCSAGDSWCAFCTAHASIDACQTFPPATGTGMQGSSSSTPSRTGYGGVPGVTSGGVPLGVSVNLGNEIPTNSFWMACTTIYGGTLWTLSSLPPPPGAYC